MCLDERMTNTTFTAPKFLYVQAGADYAGFACSERDPFQPQHNPVYWVRLKGGPVTADVRRDDVDTTTEGDPWDYAVETGLTMTAAEVADALV